MPAAKNTVALSPVHRSRFYKTTSAPAAPISLLLDRDASLALLGGRLNRKVPDWHKARAAAISFIQFVGWSSRGTSLANLQGRSNRLCPGGSLVCWVDLVLFPALSFLFQ